jgi:hypothetical protein
MTLRVRHAPEKGEHTHKGENTLKLVLLGTFYKDDNFPFFYDFLI